MFCFPNGEIVLHGDKFLINQYSDTLAPVVLSKSRHSKDFHQYGCGALHNDNKKSVDLDCSLSSGQQKMKLSLSNTDGK